jgi:hypothetical protein
MPITRSGEAISLWTGVASVRWVIPKRAYLAPFEGSGHIRSAGRAAREIHAANAHGDRIAGTPHSRLQVSGMNPVPRG